MSKFKKGDIVEDGLSNRFVILKSVKGDPTVIDVFNISGGYREHLYNWNFTLTKAKRAKFITGRVDGYGALILKASGQTYINVGCRVFQNIKEARKHWSNGPNGNHFDDPLDEDQRAFRHNANITRLKQTEKLYAKFKEKTQ